MKTPATTIAKTVFSSALFWGAAAAGGIYLIGRSAGKRKGQKQGHTIAPVEPGQLGIDPVAYAQRVESAFAGWNIPGPFPGERGEILSEMAEMTDNDLRALYNAYNERYVEAPNTLLTLIKNEVIFNSARSYVVKRMEGLGLV